MAARARFAMTYLGAGLPSLSGTLSFMLPEVSYTMATATPSSCAAWRPEEAAPSAVTAIRTVSDELNLVFILKLRLTPHRDSDSIDSKRFIRCQHIPDWR